MIHFLYTVYDTKAKIYLPPFTFKTQAEALRAFGDSVNQEEHPFNKHPEDYILFHLGQYDDNTAMVKQVVIGKESLGVGNEFIKEDSSKSKISMEKLDKLAEIKLRKEEEETRKLNLKQWQKEEDERLQNLIRENKA